MINERQEQIGNQDSLGGFEELELKRETARVKGLVAEFLEKLFPGQNLHFEIIKRGREPEIALGYLKDEFEKASALQRESLMPSARAYFCRHCGDWIKNSPHSEKDDSSGSTAYNLFCTICESPIGRVTGIRS